MKRILVLGDKGTGKTTFLNIFLNKQLHQNQEPTLGVEAAAKTIQFQNKSFVNLQIWDTPGQEEYSQMAYPFYSNCKIFILILDRSRRQTIESFPNWLQKIEQNSPNRPYNLLVILNNIPKKLQSSRKQEQFSKKSLQQIYNKQLDVAAKRGFNISIMEIDLIQQKDVLNSLYINPYLQQYLTQSIIAEAQQKRKPKCGELNCQSNSCFIM